jgi:Molecular chaperone
MPVERIIGIDFGTSTSVVKIKTYKDDQPIDAREMADYVRFDNKDSLPTLVYETTDKRYLVGYEAESPAVKGVLHQNFKLDLINSDYSKREEAIQYTETFLKYLFDTYNQQKNYFPACDIETTYISYPAKWSDGLRETMINLVEKVGFRNVKGLDEPTAAIHTVMVQESGKLTLNDDGSANILMIDMGAGTTDLVLSRYTPNSGQQISIINVWPKADSPCLFGGREIDEILCEYIKAYLVNCGLPNTKNFKEKYLDKCKTWKETSISPVFKDKNGVVRYCGFVESLTAMLNVDIEFPPLSRDSFEDMLRDYITQFTKMINDCLDDAGFSREDLDYVILTGGHSQWYFTNEILEGNLLKFGRVELPKIQIEKSRIIKLSRPQETVALGLVYQKIAVNHVSRPTVVSNDEVFCGYCGAKKPADAVYCPHCGKSTFSKPAPGPVPNIPDVPAVDHNKTISSDIYEIPGDKDIAGLANTVNNLLSTAKGMDSQIINLEDGSVILQARDKGGKWKQWIGMDKAITVKFQKVDSNRVSVNIGESKWVDKVGIMALSMFILWPLTITSGIGMYIQGKLPGEIKNEVFRYLAS